MKRLTQKQDDSYVFINGEFHNIGKHINKLGELEDIESELGIDLITLLNASMNGFYALYISGEVDPDKWEPWHFIIDMKNRCFRSLTTTGELGRTEFYFSEYGKTWTLTKEE